MYMHTYICTYTHTYKHTYIHKIYTYIHTHNLYTKTWCTLSCGKASICYFTDFFTHHTDQFQAMNLIVLLQSVDVLLSKWIVDSIQLHFCVSTRGTFMHLPWPLFPQSQNYNNELLTGFEVTVKHSLSTHIESATERWNIVSQKRISTGQS